MTKNRVARWCYAIQGKEFMCDFFDDETCDFYSWDDRNSQAKSDKNIFLRAFAGDLNAIKNVENHEREFTITVEGIDTGLLSDIKELNEKLDREGDITKREEREIDHRLDPYFWEQVNPFLSKPLSSK